MEYQLKTYLHQKLNQFSSLFRRDAPEMTTDQLLRMYSNSPWLRAVTNKIGQAVGTTDWRLFEPMTGNGRAMVERMSAAQTDPAERNAEVLRGIQRDDLRELTDHPALDMLRNGNEEFSGLLSMKLTQVYVDLVGEGFWLKERNRGGVPIAYWPLPSTWIRDLPRPDQPYFLIRADRTGEPTPVPIKEVVYIRDPNPARPYGRGTGIADSLGDELDIDDQSSKFIKSFFYNRARPDLIVHSDNFSREDAERVEKKWKEGHQGFWNQFKPLFINREVKIEQLSQSFESMQLSTMRQQERDVIINVFSVPPEKLGILSSSNRSTIDQADNFWEKDIVKPRVELLRSEIQRQLINPDFGSGLLLHYQMPEYRDETLQSSLMRALPFAFLANDIRELAGKPSLGADGDFLMVPSNSQQVFVNPPSEQSRTALPDPRRQELRLKIRRALETPEGRRAVAGHVRRRLEDKRASAVIDDS